MEIYKTEKFFTHLEKEIANSEKSKHPFSLIAVRINDKANTHRTLFESIIDAELRSTDLITYTDTGVHLILLHRTTKEQAVEYLNRLVQIAVVENGLNIATSVETYRELDEYIDMLLRLYVKLR